MSETDSMLPDFLERQARLYPNRAAVITTAGVTSYQQLIAHVDTTAGWLLSLGILREMPIAVCAGRSLTWIVGALAVLRAGGVYIPVDPTAPLPRKERLLEETGAKLLLVESRLLVALPDTIETAVLDIDRKFANPGWVAPEIFPDQAAYGIYTSGSVGAPKSVTVSHNSLKDYASTLQRDFMLAETDRYLHTASLAFSASIRQLVAPLVSGAAVVIATREEIRDPISLVSWMAASGVTVLDTVPSYLVRLLAAVVDSPGGVRDRLSASLRLVFTTGETLTSAVAKSFKHVFPKAQLFNLYGQTETTGTISCHEAQSNSPDPVPIGLPLGPSRFYVLNDRLEAAEDGELYISGTCIARCYQGRPDITASHFLADPFSLVPGTRMYRTGDRVHRLENGLLQFKGRADTQVKVHGVRIELNEIDTTLLKHPEVQDAVTLLRSTGEQEMRLVAFIVRRPGKHSFDLEELQRFVASILPDVMVPRLVVLLDQFPRTASGKIDRPALTARNISPLPAPRSSSAVPRTLMELLVAKCWEDTLKVSGIGIEDEFFELGGDSIQAIEMMWQLQKLLPEQVHLGALFFQDPRLENFAKAIEAELVTAV